MKPIVKPWTEVETALLRRLVQQGVSAPRASVALKRNTASVKRRAWQLGLGFPGARRRRAPDVCSSLSCTST
jgi:hypothetical protein